MKKLIFFVIWVLSVAFFLWQIRFDYLPSLQEKNMSTLPPDALDSIAATIQTTMILYGAFVLISFVFFGLYFLNHRNPAHPAARIAKNNPAKIAIIATIIMIAFSIVTAWGFISPLMIQNSVILNKLHGVNSDGR